MNLTLPIINPLVFHALMPWGGWGGYDYLKGWRMGGAPWARRTGRKAWKHHRRVRG